MSSDGDAGKGSKGITASEQKELRRVFLQLSNYLPKRAIYQELDPLLARHQSLT